MSYYLDASAIVPAFMEEVSSDAVETFLDANAAELAVSDFAAAEFASAVSRLVRMGALAAENAIRRLNEFDLWRTITTRSIDLVASDARAADAVVRRFALQLRTPDALHIAICRRTGATLVTLDQRLADAAGELGVACHIPGARPSVITAGG